MERNGQDGEVKKIRIEHLMLKFLFSRHVYFCPMKSSFLVSSMSSYLYWVVVHTPYSEPYFHLNHIEINGQCS